MVNIIMNKSTLITGNIFEPANIAGKWPLILLQARELQYAYRQY